MEAFQYLDFKTGFSSKVKLYNVEALQNIDYFVLIFDKVAHMYADTYPTSSCMLTHLLWCWALIFQTKPNLRLPVCFILC